MNGVIVQSGPFTRVVNRRQGVGSRIAEANPRVYLGDSMSDLEEWFVYDLTRRVAMVCEVDRKRVTSCGEVQDAQIWQAICRECTMRRVNAPFYFEPVEDAVPDVRVQHSVTLLPKLRLIDRRTQPIERLCIVLTGQCEDCGHTYFAWFVVKGKIW